MFKQMSLLRGLSSDTLIPLFELIGDVMSSSTTFLLRSYNSVLTGSWQTKETKSSNRWNEFDPIFFIS